MTARFPTHRFVDRFSLSVWCLCALPFVQPVSTQFSVLVLWQFTRFSRLHVFPSFSRALPPVFFPLSLPSRASSTPLAFTAHNSILVLFAAILYRLFALPSGLGIDVSSISCCFLLPRLLFNPSHPTFLSVCSSHANLSVHGLACLMIGRQKPPTLSDSGSDSNAVSFSQLTSTLPS